MSTSDPARTAAERHLGSPTGAAKPDGGSALREDLEAVWAISASDGPGAGVDAVLAFAGAALQRAAMVNDDKAAVDEAAEVALLVAEIVDITEPAARRTLFRHAARRLALLGGDPSASLAAQLRLLVMLAPVSGASVWLRLGAGVEPAGAAGRYATTRRCKRAAELALDGADVSVDTTRVHIHAYPLRHRDRRAGALVIRLGGETYPDVLPFLEEFALVFSSIRERELLLAATSSDGQRLGQTYERRLVRTAFDLHDGPLQDLAALGTELCLLRTQIREAESLRADVLVGRIDDVTVRLTELDQSLRAIARSLETSTLEDTPLEDALKREAESFRRRTTITVDVGVSGSLDTLTMSQRIAVVRIVQEALSNVRAHSEATEVRVDLRATEDGIDLRVADNGRGFDLSATAAAAAKRGRLGIVGMNERVRLLGGVFAIESMPSVGTTVFVSIPAWRPLGT
ncbi:MAG TPA: sensor histidine kinase [Gaiellaceae bacterium]|nr:sensor histidine kinase [Gaiellaceae bacterium]